MSPCLQHKMKLPACSPEKVGYKCHTQCSLLFSERMTTRCCLHLQSEAYSAQAGIPQMRCPTFALERLVSLTLAAHHRPPDLRLLSSEEAAGTSSHRKITRHRGPCCAQGPGNSPWNSSDRSPFDFSHRPRSCTKMSGMLGGVRQLVTRQLCLCHT